MYMHVYVCTHTCGDEMGKQCLAATSTCRMKCRIPVLVHSFQRGARIDQGLGALHIPPLSAVVQRGAARRISEGHIGVQSEQPLDTASIGGGGVHAHVHGGARMLHGVHVHVHGGRACACACACGWGSCMCMWMGGTCSPTDATHGLDHLRSK